MHPQEHSSHAPAGPIRRGVSHAAPPVGPLQDFDAEVSRVADLTHDVRVIELALRDPTEMAFLPGQFVSFEVPKAGFARLVTRPYSIASPPGQRSSIELLFNRVPGGPGSSYLFGLKEHDRVTFRGPAGTFILREYPDRDLLFVATGTGIAPIRSMVLSRLGTGNPRKVALCWGLRREADLYYQDLWRELTERYPNFSYSITLSRPSAEWTGPAGRVQQLVQDRLASMNNVAAYVCGNSGMIASVTELVRRTGLCPIHREQYYLGEDDAASDRA